MAKESYACRKCNGTTPNTKPVFIRVRCDVKSSDGIRPAERNLYNAMVDGICGGDGCAGCVWHAVTDRYGDIVRVFKA